MKLYNPTPPELRFQKEVDFLFKENNSKARSLFYLIKRSLRQFHLDGCYEVQEIVNIAYLRGVRRTRSGEVIHNPIAWLKTTSYNVIREISRARRQRLDVEYGEITESKIAQDNPSKTILDALIVEEEFSKHVELVQTALVYLSIQERELIELRNIQQLSWEEVRNHLSSENSEEVKIATLRKRGQRALNHLREVYHQLERESKFDSSNVVD